MPLPDGLRAYDLGQVLEALGAELSAFPEALAAPPLRAAARRHLTYDHRWRDPYADAAFVEAYEHLRSVALVEESRTLLVDAIPRLRALLADVVVAEID